MMEIRGNWFDGKTSQAVPAICRVTEEGAVFILCEKSRTQLSGTWWKDVRVGPRIGSGVRSFSFPGGEIFETFVNDAVDALIRQHKTGLVWRMVHGMESRLRFVAVAVLLFAGLLFGGIRYGIPFMAGVVAPRLPQGMYATASDKTLKTLDAMLLDPTELPASVQERVQQRFAPLVAAHREYGIQVLFRKGNAVGANAFALPDGTVVFTDAMVELAIHDAELEAVLAHEIGHVVHRHAMRRMIQDSLLAFTFMAITGDVSGSSELFFGLPVMLTELSYSRGFEREADLYALAWLQENGIAPLHFARLMERVAKEAGEEQNASSWKHYLSTHPHTKERLIPFKAAE